MVNIIIETKINGNRVKAIRKRKKDIRSKKKRRRIALYAETIIYRKRKVGRGKAKRV
jgi:hypothetical protein